MKIKLLTILPVVMMFVTTRAQTSYFNSLHKSHQDGLENVLSGDSITESDTTNISRNQTIENKQTNTLKSFVSNLSVEELEYLVSDYKIRHHFRENKSKNEVKDVRLHFYEGESHPLTMGSVLKVMDEVGVKNQLIVLAQSLLETGFYRSNICKTCNNLFGLRNPHTGSYYKFERWEDSVVGYVKFVQYKYKDGNYFSFLRRIGYAEDPKYIYKVAKITKLLAKGDKITD